MIQQTSAAYANAKKATLKQIRALKIGDLIQCFYVDEEKPILELVVRCCTSTVTGSLDDIKTVALDRFGSRREPFLFGGDFNTDKFVCVGRLQVTQYPDGTYVTSHVPAGN